MPEIVFPYQKDGTPTIGNLAGLIAGLILRSEVSGLLTQPGNAVGDALAGKAARGENADITRLLGLNGTGIDFLASSTSVASAATVDLGSVPTLKVQITGAATIASFGTGSTAAHRVRLLHFTGACTLTASANLVLPGAVSRTVAPGDRAIATSDASGVWTVWVWGRSDGKAYTPPAAADVSDATATGRAVMTAATAAAGRTALGAAQSGANADLTKLSGTSAAPGIDFLAAATTVASAATVDLGAQTTLKVLISGAATITSFGSAAHVLRLVTFQAAATLTYNATSLILPGAANLVTAAGDTALVTSDASGNWTVRHYQRASGKAVTGPASTDITDASASGRSVLTGTAAQGATALGLGTGNTPTLAGLNSMGAAGDAPVMLGGGSNTGAEVKFLKPGVAHYSIYNGAGTLRFANTSSNSATNIAGADMMVFLGTGNVGIGTATPASKLHVAGDVTVGGVLYARSYTVATLPTGSAGGIVYASNARKVGEAAGSGTGVIAYYSNGNWRRLSDDSAVAA